MSTPCFDPLDDPDDDDIWGWGEEEDWRGDEHPAPLAVDWEGVEYMAGPEYRFYKKLSETRWALTPLGEAIRHEVKWPETRTYSERDLDPMFSWED